MKWAYFMHSTQRSVLESHSRRLKRRNQARGELVLNPDLVSPSRWQRQTSRGISSIHRHHHRERLCTTAETIRANNDAPLARRQSADHVNLLEVVAMIAVEGVVE